MKQDLHTILTRLLDASIPGWEKDDELRGALHALTRSETFKPPTVEEVTAHMRSMGIINPEDNAAKFWNHYEAKGWMIGKNKMKKWKSAVSTWNLPVKGKGGLIV